MKFMELQKEFQSGKITKLLNIKYPIIQGGMVWVSGAKLAAAISESGGLGLIGAGSMQPLLLKTHIIKAQSLTKNPIGVNVPLLYEKAQEQIETALELGIKIFFTSAGSPKKFTSMLKRNDAIVIHVISSSEQALKCEDQGVDAVVAEGVEAGGHNGIDELSSFVLLPQIVSAVKIPVIAAGGIYNAKSLLAAQVLGASGVQMGTRFLMCKESSAHQNFKNYLLKENKNLKTRICMRELTPVRLFQNKFESEIAQIEKEFIGEALKTQLKNALSKNRAKWGMLEGNIDEGELEVGQVVALINSIPNAKEIITQIIDEYNAYFQTEHV